ncbi:hypothetical protein [Methylomagnum sp.]
MAVPHFIEITRRVAKFHHSVNDSRFKIPPGFLVQSPLTQYPTNNFIGYFNHLIQTGFCLIQNKFFHIRKYLFLSRHGVLFQAVQVTADFPGPIPNQPAHLAKARAFANATHLFERGNAIPANNRGYYLGWQQGFIGGGIENLERLNGVKGFTAGFRRVSRLRCLRGGGDNGGMVAGSFGHF